MEFIVLKVTDVDTTVRHNHSTLVAFIVFPLTFKNASIGPYHFALTLSLSLAEFSSVLSLLKFLAISS